MLPRKKIAVIICYTLEKHFHIWYNNLELKLRNAVSPRFARLSAAQTFKDILLEYADTANYDLSMIVDAL